MQALNIPSATATANTGRAAGELRSRPACQAQSGKTFAQILSAARAPEKDNSQPVSAEASSPQQEGNSLTLRKTKPQQRQQQDASGQSEAEATSANTGAIGGPCQATIAAIATLPLQLPAVESTNAPCSAAPGNEQSQSTKTAETGKDAPSAAAAGSKATPAASEQPQFCAEFETVMAPAVEPEPSDTYNESLRPSATKDQADVVPQSSADRNSAPSAQAAPPSPNVPIADPLIQSLLKHAERLQQTAENERKTTAQPVTVEVSNKAVAPKAAKANAAGGQTLGSKLPIPIEQSAEAVRQSQTTKPEQAHVAVANPKATPAAPLQSQQQADARQESAQSYPGSDDCAGNPVGDTKEFTKLAVEATKAQVEISAQQSSSTDPNQAQGAVIQQSLIAAHQDKTNTSAVQSPSANQTTSPAPTTASSGPNWRVPDEATTKGVSSAQLADAANHTEMRIAMQTDKLGNIELRAHLSGETVGAAITVEKRDAHSVLAVELPALQQALSEKSLRVDQVALFQGSLNLNDGQTGKDAQQQHATATQQLGRSHTGQSVQGSRMSFDYMQTGAFDASGRLNVHA